MSLREAAEKALGWMESAWYKINGEWDPLERSPDDEPEITNLCDALLEAEAPKAEPVAWMHNQRVDCIHNEVKELLKRAGGHLHRPLDKTENYTIPLYTHPPEPVDEEVIGKHSGASDKREWWTRSTWLYPGDTVVVRRAAARGKG